MKFILKNQLFIISVVYLVAGAVLLSYFQYHLQTDGISYISIAEKYLSGNFYDAVNAYWGPLFSWLLAPVLGIIKQPVIASKITSLFVGLLLIWAVRRILASLQIPGRLIFVTLCSVIPIVLYFVFLEAGPDIVLAAILICYIAIFNKAIADQKKILFVYSGLAAGAAYLTKSYALPFFLVHFSACMLVALWRNPERQKLIKGYLLGIVSCLVIVMAWSGILYWKYQKFTLGTSGSYNHALIGPESQGLISGHLFYHQLFSPPNKSAVSIWEDPSMLPVASWSPVASMENLVYQLKLIVVNTYKSFVIYRRFSIFFPAVILFIILFLIEKRKDSSAEKSYMLNLLIGALVFNAGYLLVFVEERYLWFNYVLWMIMAAFSVGQILKNNFSKYAGAVLITVVMGSFFLAPAALIVKNRYINKPTAELASLLKKEYGLSGNIASNFNAAYNEKMVSLAYYTGSKYFGMVDESLLQKTLLSALKDDKIDYYFIWGEPVKNQNFDPSIEITKGLLPGLQIYHISN